MWWNSFLLHGKLFEENLLILCLERTRRLIREKVHAKHFGCFWGTFGRLKTLRRFFKIGCKPQIKFGKIGKKSKKLSHLLFTLSKQLILFPKLSHSVFFSVFNLYNFGKIMKKIANSENKVRSIIVYINSN